MNRRHIDGPVIVFVAAILLFLWAAGVAAGWINFGNDHVLSDLGLAVFALGVLL